mmetsp:Transcript_28191/g.81665  ORF Transcript_28191/g.81665 Transcript_28191/m.81665 type:complete len:208 (+) Transcript_28191:1294-1917(+)
MGHERDLGRLQPCQVRPPGRLEQVLRRAPGPQAALQPSGLRREAQRLRRQAVHVRLRGQPALDGVARALVAARVHGFRRRVRDGALDQQRLHRPGALLPAAREGVELDLRGLRRRSEHGVVPDGGARRVHGVRGERPLAGVRVLRPLQLLPKIGGSGPHRPRGHVLCAFQRLAAELHGHAGLVPLFRRFGGALAPSRRRSDDDANAG